MIRLAIIVEGRTEEEFVKQVLMEYLRRRSVESQPILLGRARGRFGGGNVSVERLGRDMAYLLHSFDVVTSLVDYYGFRKKGDLTVEELGERVKQQVGMRYRHADPSKKVLPYIQRHEFESLLFSDVDVFSELIDVAPDSVETLRGVRAQFSTPEDIDDGRDTAPSKRIAGAIPTYNKNVDGPRLAMKTGLAAIREECPRFSHWLMTLESLGEKESRDSTKTETSD